MFHSSTKFLVVDDFATMRTIVRKSLTELGFSNIEEAESGLQALDMLGQAMRDQRPFDFIISDWSMPEMSGIDLLKKCRQHDVYKSLPFMIVTAESEQKQILQAARAGVNEYLIKPFTTEALGQKLARVHDKLKDKKTA